MSRRFLRPRLTATVLAIAACFAADVSGTAGVAQANPTNPVVTNGTATFNQAGNVLTITNSPNTIINWSSFSIGASEITRFIQQSSASAVLNRVGAGGNPSSILGALQSNGRLFLINPNGITFGAGSQINVAGLVASSLNLSDADFLAGRMRFADGPGNSVINNGNITSGAGGSVYLIGNAVANNGIITSPKGEVLLAAGNSVELVNPGTPDLRVEIVAPDNQAVNLGQIVANSGRIGIYAGLINHAGSLNANSVDIDTAGNITLRATKNIDLAAASQTTANGATGGAVTVQSGDTTLATGTIEAKGSTGQGGTVHVLGNLVGLTGNATLNASGNTGGGTILVGGDYQGKNTNIQNAFRTYVGQDTTIRADAISNGNGGKVIVWADDVTRAYGAISAHGGALSGNGGFVETSGKRYLDVTRAPDLSARNGNGGTWLLDPEDITISAGGGSNITGASPFSPVGAGSSVLNVGTLTTALNGGGTVIVDTTGGAAGIGDINVNAAITTTGTSTLDLRAHNDINISNPIAGANLSLALTPNQDSAGGGSANISANINIGGTITSPSRSVVFSGNPTITAATLQVGTITISSGTTTLNANTDAGSLSMSGGVLTGTGNFDFGGGGGGNVNWSGGTIAGTGSMVTNPDNPPNISGPVVLQRNWTALDGVRITGSGSLNIDGATVTIPATQTAEINSNAATQIFGTGTLINNGTVEINTSGAQAVIAVANYTNAAGSTVDLNTGDPLRVSASGTDAANYNWSFGGTLEFAGGARTFTGGGINGGSGGTGTLIVSGGSVTIPAATTVSMNTMQVTGGALTMDSAVSRSYIDASFTGGTATFNGAQINFPGILNVATGATLTGTSNFDASGATGFTWTGGVISGTGTLLAGTVTIPASGTLVGRSITAGNIINNGVYSGTGTLNGNVTNNGTVSPGNSPGILVITGSYTQTSSGVLQIELGGTTPGTGYDQLQVLGNANLAGTMVITQYGAFIPTPADTFQPIVTFSGTVIGTFASVVVPPVFAGLSATYLPFSVDLGGAIGFGSSTVALDPRIVREDKDIFAQVNEDKDIFNKLRDSLTCN